VERVDHAVARDVDVGLQMPIPQVNRILERSERVFDARVLRQECPAPVRESKGDEGRRRLRVEKRQMSRKVSICAPKALSRSARSSYPRWMT